MPDTQTRQRRTAQRQRARYDQPRTAAQTAPTAAQRQRAFAAAVLDLPAPAVSDALLHAVLDQATALLAVVPAHSRRHAARTPATYLAPYFGLAWPVQSLAQIAQALGVPTPALQRWVRRAVAAMQAQLARTCPDLWAAATACREAPPGDDAAFWDRVDRSGECWAWQGATDMGYGVVRRQGRKQQAHRYAYVLAYGPLPARKRLTHRCGNRRCVNPAHLAVEG